jgi:hypothetical protein
MVADWMAKNELLQRPVRNAKKRGYVGREYLGV